MRIGILKTDHAPDDLLQAGGDYDVLFHRLLDGHGFDFTTWDVEHGALPEGPRAADGWLITGSKYGAYDGLDWFGPLEALIRDIHAAQVPLVGICFGHQIVAQALGGRVEKNPHGWTVGATEYEIDGRPVTLNAWHQDTVTQVPDALEVTGHGPHGGVAALRGGDHIWTLQPHPEFDADYVDVLIRNYGPGEVPEPLLAGAAARLGVPTDSSEIGQEMAAFLLKKERA